MTRTFSFALVFSASELERRYYREGLNSIVVMTEQGLSVQLPIQRLIPFITTEGIRGYFSLILDQQNRFISIHKVRDL